MFTCLLCGSTDTPEHLFLIGGQPGVCTGQQFPIVRCRECTCISLWPQPSDETLASVYDASYYTPHGTILAARVYALLLLLWRKRRRALIWRLKPTGRVLDVGCGAGELVAELLAAGYDAYGVDVSPDTRQVTPAEIAPRITIGSLANCDYPPRSFDLVMLFDVLEHARDPRALLRDVRSLLTDTGFLVVSVPNWKSAEAAVFGRQHWYNTDAPRHLWHFTAETLGRLLAAEGFTVTRTFPLGLVTLLEAPLILVHGWQSVLQHSVSSPTLRAVLAWCGALPLFFLTPVLRLLTWGEPRELRFVARQSPV